MADPTCEMDSLPQPYRMLAKLIDMEILDPAWLEITRLHPELLLDSEGEPLSLRPNYALKNSCTPSSVTEQSFLATSLVEAQDFLIMTTSNDACVLADPTSGAVVQSLLLKSGDYESMNLLPTANPTKASPPWIAAISPPVSNDRVLRVVVCGIVEIEEAIAPPEGEVGGKKPPPKKGAAAEPEPMKKVGKCRISVVEVRLGGMGRLKSPALIKMSLAFECFLSLDAASKSEIYSADLSFDAELLAIATSKGLFLYSLPRREDRADEGISMEKVTEDTECEEDTEELKPTVLEPILVLESDKFFANKAVKHVILTPLAPLSTGDSSVIKAAAQAQVQGGRARALQKRPAIGQCPFYRTGISVTFEDEPLWLVLGLKSTSADQSELKSEAGDKVSATVISKFILTANVSALTTDEGKSIAILGLCDGSIVMWNLSSRVFTSIVGRHETAPTSICICRAESVESKNQSSYYIISGALDGTLCFFSLFIPRAASVSSDLFFSSSIDSAPACISATFNAFRKDVDTGCSVVGIRSLKNLPLAVVQYSNGLGAIYDLQGSKQLLGKFVLYSGIMSKQINWRIANVKEILSACMSIEGSPESEVGEVIEQTNLVASSSSSSSSSNPNSRAPKYHISSPEDLRGINGLDSVSAPSRYGFHAIYYRNDSPVLALFRLEDIFVSLFPGLNAVCAQGAHTELPRMIYLFNKLGPAERLDANLATERMANSFLDNIEGRGVPPSAQAPGTGKVRKDSRAGTGGPKGSASSSAPQRRGSEPIRTTGKRNSKGVLGTEGFGSSAAGLPKVSSDAEGISKLAWDRIVEPTQEATKSAWKHQAERLARKNRLQNSLESIGKDLASSLP